VKKERHRPYLSESKIVNTASERQVRSLRKKGVNEWQKLGMKEK
jgi:hypothetical protein